MVINKNLSKLYKFCVLQATFLLKFVGTVSSIISPHIITELSITLAKFLRFLQIHLAEF